jgi:peptide/nickel transport system substrate-binding protein
MSRITRRTAIALTAAATLPHGQPAIAQAGAQTLRFVPQSDLVALDPIWTTGYVVRNHGYMVFDTLYAMDSGFRVRPQMAEGHEVTNNQRYRSGERAFVLEL